MLSSLPTELIQEIIESAIPHTFHSTTYEDRQTILCSLSLVSKLFRSIAQPLLLEIVWIGTDEDFTLPNAEKVAHSSREVILGYYVDFGAVEEMPLSFHGLQALTINSDGDRVLNLDHLCDFPNLMKLQLTGDPFVLDSPQPLTSLRSLSVDYLSFDKVHLLLDPLYLPSLSALGLILFTDSEELEALEKSQISELLPQLDSIFVDPRLYFLAEATLLAGLSSRILVDADTYDLPVLSRVASTASHLRIHEVVSSQQNLEGVEHLSSLIASQLEPETHQLRSIYLDPSFNPLESGSTVLSRAVGTLMDECERRRIEIIFEAQEGDEIDPYISEEFWRRQRRERIKREGGEK